MLAGLSVAQTSCLSNKRRRLDGHQPPKKSAWNPAYKGAFSMFWSRIFVWNRSSLCQTAGPLVQFVFIQKALTRLPKQTAVSNRARHPTRSRREQDSKMTKLSIFLIAVATMAASVCAPVLSSPNVCGVPDAFSAALSQPTATQATITSTAEIAACLTTCPTSSHYSAGCFCTDAHDGQTFPMNANANPLRGTCRSSKSGRGHPGRTRCQE
jgi:hypothetical protein